MTRNQFFLLLFTVATGPFAGYKLWWLATSKQTTGIMYFVGHDGLGSAMGISIGPFLVLVVLFFTPDSLDPLVPRRSRVFLGKNPLIKIIHL